MNDCLSLPLRQGSGGIRPLVGWECLWSSLGEGEAEGLPGGRGSGWRPAEVPGQLWASAGRQSVWYRSSFPRPDHGGRVVLRVGGAFLAANVWLNGKLLGSHYGYFAPFGFDLTSQLRPENLLVICCESPIETDLARKRHVMGSFNDGDSRPYPASAYFSLPPEFRWEVPLGLWRPVELEYTGSVVLDWLRLKPRLEADVGRLEVECRLRNLDGRQMSGELAVEVQGPDATAARLRREYTVAGGTEQTAAMTLSLPSVRLWWPWRRGEQPIYSSHATVSAGGKESVSVEDSFGFRDVVTRSGPDGWRISVNGEALFLRGANYQPGIRLDDLGPELFERDLQLTRELGLDALRVHAQVLPDAFYRQADRSGLLVLQDLPLTLSYAYHAGLEEARFFETSVREQAREMVEMLRNRPSILMWTGHDAPPWITANAELADLHAVRQNYTLDQEIKALVEDQDPSRAALAASGDQDLHAYAGWGQGSWADFADCEAGLVTEFGAQALPSLDSPVWDAIGRRWPVADDEPAWLYAGFQAARWAQHGSGLPSAQEDLATYIDASQRYQADLLAFAIDQLRKRKLEPCWGAFVYQLVDAFPGIGFGLLDAERRPRLAFLAVREALAATRLIVEPVGFQPLQPFGFGFQPGRAAGFRLICVNDDFGLEGDASVRWTAGRDTGSERTGIGRIAELVRRRSFSGGTSFQLPSAREPALQVAAISLPVEVLGGYRLDAELWSGGRLLQRTGLEFEVGSGVAPQPRPLIPGYLAERIAAAGSLRPDASGLRFTLLNRTRPAVLTRLDGIRLDGLSEPLARVLVETPSGRVPLPKRLELAPDRAVEIVVETGVELPEGPHEVEFEVELPGVAGGRLRIGGPPGRT